MNAAAHSRASPMVVAYAAAQASAPGHLLLYRVGELYEMLHQDAATVSRLLGIQLTPRPQKNAPDIPMCGISVGSAEVATVGMLATGRKVAVSEQLTELSGQRPLRLLTPGTSARTTGLRLPFPLTATSRLPRMPQIFIACNDSESCVVVF